MIKSSQMTIRKLAIAFQKAGQEQFTYMSEMEKNGTVEEWESEEKAFLAGGKFYGDCDTYALTIVRALKIVTNLIKPKDLILFSCTVKGVGHLVSGILDRTTNKTYVFDNRFKGIQSLESLIVDHHYQFDGFATLEHITKWWKSNSDYPYDFRTSGGKVSVLERQNKKLPTKKEETKQVKTKVDWNKYKNFSEVEFKCKCGCGKADMKPLLLDKLQAIRDYLGEPITVVSGFRCKKHNKKVGGKKKSAHLKGQAVDIGVYNSRFRYRFKREAYKNKITRIGDYKKRGFIHVDISKTLPQFVEW